MIARLFVQKSESWFEMDVSDKLSLSLINNSEFLGAEQSGSFSFTDTLPMTANNRNILGGIENPQSMAERIIEFPAKLLIGSAEINSWYFVLRETGYDGYRYDLIKTPGNQPRNFYERKLHELDFGSLPLTGGSISANIWAINVFPTENPKISTDVEAGIIPYYELLVNGVIVSKSPDSINPLAPDQYFNTLNKYGDPYEHINNWLNKTVNADNLNYQVAFRIDEKGKGYLNLVKIKADYVISSVEFKTYNWYFSGVGEGVIYVSKTIKHSYTLTLLNYIDVRSAISVLTNAPSSVPFRFITYFNDSFYPSDDADYEGIVNQYSSAYELKLNDSFNRTTYPISPCFSFSFILQKLAEMMGYTFVSSIFKDANTNEDANLEALFFINNVDLAAQLPGTNLPFNIYPNVIKYADFMPDLTVKGFIDAVRTTFALYVEYDETTGQMIVEKMDSILESDEIVDISDKVGRWPKSDSSEKKYFQLKFKDSDENIKLVRNYPSDLVTKASNLKYTPIEAGFTPALNSRDLDEFLSNDAYPGIPTVNESARTPIYENQFYNRPTQKMTFFLSMPVLNTVTGKYHTKADNKNNQLILSWRDAEGLQGLVSYCYARYLAFLDNTTQWTTDINLTDIEFSKFRYSKKYYAYGTLFLAETLKIKVPVREKGTLAMLSL
jgi:hypothetical protein